MVYYNSNAFNIFGVPCRSDLWYNGKRIGENYFYICIFTVSSDKFSMTQVSFLTPGDADERHLRQTTNPYQLCSSVHYYIWNYATRCTLHYKEIRYIFIVDHFKLLRLRVG